MKTMHPDLLLFAEAMDKIGLQVSPSPQADKNFKIHCYYRNNPDGSIRWIWPAQCRQPHFLKFYHVAGIRSGLFAATMKLLAATRQLKQAGHGSFCLYADNTTADVLQGTWHHEWAFFSGTVGPNRKALLWGNNKSSGEKSYYKIPLTTKASFNLLHEYDHLHKADGYQTAGVQFPQSRINASGVLQLEDVGEDTCRTNDFKNLPLESTQNWLLANRREIAYETSSFAATIEQRLKKITSLNDERIPAVLIKRLQELNASLNGQNSFITTHAHGDFTPWNVLVNGNNLRLIDLELSCGEMPFLYDLFHFIYQSNILVKRKSYAAIRNEIAELEEHQSWKNFISSYANDFQRYEAYYLLYTVSYYLIVYSNQPQWHKQVDWLLRVWNEAIAYQLQTVVSPRKLVLQDISLMLSSRQHAILKWMYQSLDALPTNADIDLCMKKKHAVAFCAEMKKHSLIKLIRVRKKSFMTAVELVLIDGSFLHLDLIHSFKRKSIEFMSAPDVLKNSLTNRNGICTASPLHDFLYTWLFYWLNGKSVPQRYQDHFSFMDDHQKASIVRQVNQRFPLPIHSLEQLYVLEPGWLQRVVNILKIEKQNIGAAGALHRINYMVDSMKNLFPRKGFIITFSGVDGAGKSTVIENVKNDVEKRLRRKVIVLRHRPSLLPILSAIKHGKEQAELRAASTLPRQGTNQSRFSSLLRFLYYYTDYFVGQFYVRLRYVNRGYVVLYDRYYFDFINDSRRSNIYLPKTFLRAAYTFLLKPSLNFFLYADAEIIYKRKQELQPATICQLTSDYLQLFQQLKSNRSSARYIALENDQLDATLHTIFQHINQKVS